MNIDERDVVAARFGVAPEQVERDHLISHLLAVLSDRFADRLHFIGGTALARTHLVDGRLSEDIDLVALGDRTELAAEIDAALPRAVARTHGRLSWDPALGTARDTAAAHLRTASGLTVKVQLLSSKDRTVWPAERRPLAQRYRDAPPAQLTVPTREQIWDGLVESCDALSGEALAPRHAFADAAKLFDWPAVLGFLDSHPRLMNTTRPGGGSGFTPLHQAAYGNASPTVIGELVARGGWLTLEGVDAKLVVSSGCRVSGGSGQRHEIPSAGSTLVEEGFV